MREVEPLLLRWIRLDSLIKYIRAIATVRQERMLCKTLRMRDLEREFEMERLDSIFVPDGTTSTNIGERNRKKDIFTEDQAAF
jgi:hypothetical protein